ncbi:MAG: YncE family protein [Dysgonamonadaceae bacterium]|jgi:DNA-binding beta-propeller fold protein YncE|nr:YncE family protein [Dysgonamonadaceae bacterium]
MKNIYLFLVFAFLVLFSCREEMEVFKQEEETVAGSEDIGISGFYLLNEGNMGSNKSTLDYYDYGTGDYNRNIFGSANPSVPKELGDVGNDIKIYGEKLYAVINCSNKVEVMDKYTAKRIGQINIPNCRYIRFEGRYAYVTSYAGPVELNPEYKQLGYVAKVDTATLEVVDRCMTGFQPDELEIYGGRIYVANSGGYMFPNYESTVSVIDIATFTEIDRIEVARNLHHLRIDRHGMLWVTSRGDYYTQPSRLYYIDTGTNRLIDSLNIAVSNFHLDGDSLYIYSVEWSYVTMSNTVTYGIVDVNKKEIITHNFITDGTDAKIKIPYGIIVNPVTKDIYVTDAKNYVSPGTLYCFGSDGKQKWNVRTGDIPAHFVFLYETSDK